MKKLEASQKKIAKVPLTETQINAVGGGLGGCAMYMKIGKAFRCVSYKRR